MGNRFSLERVKSQGSGDPVLLLLLIILAGLGVVSLFSATNHNAGVYSGDPLYYLKRRSLFLAVGVLVYFISSRISLDWLRKLIPAILITTLLMLAATYIPKVGKSVLGGARWIQFGAISVQPSEFAKLSLVLYLASILGKNRDRLDDPLNTLLPPLIVSSIFVGVVFFQNDFSTSLFILFLALTLFFVASVQIRYFVLIGVVVLPLVGIMLFTREHRVERLISFLDPERDPVGTGFQILSSRIALSSGGLWGKGLGNGDRKLASLPEVQSDFIFASLGEEIGFFGILAVVALFLLFATRGYLIAVGCKDRFRHLLAFGVTTSILYQAFFNMAVVVGIVPATGIPLPLFSAGGSSLMTTMAMCGLLQNVARGSNGRVGDGIEGSNIPSPSVGEEIPSGRGMVVGVNMEVRSE